MAQLLLIKSLAADTRQPGDVVGVFEDTHQFSELEKQVFTIVKLKSTTAEINALRPQTADVVKAPTLDWTTEDKLERKRAWVDSSGAMKEIVEEPKFALRYEDGLFKNVYALDSKNSTVLVAAKTEVVKD